MSTKSIVVENVSTFRRIQTPYHAPYQLLIPETREKRKLTDVAFLISFSTCVAILLGLMIYAFCNSNIDRYIHGYDKCGNVCGSKNTAIDGIPCSGQDMTEKPYLLYEELYYDEYAPYECVESCNSSTYIVTSYRCVPRNANLDSNITEILDEESSNIAILCAIGVGLSVVALILFRYFVKEFVWAMIISGILLMFAFSGFFWYLYSDSDPSSKTSFLIWAIFFTFISIVFALCILVLTERIKLIIFFFDEAVRIVFAMPLLLLEPILTFISNFLVLAIFVFSLILMISGGDLQESDSYFRSDVGKLDKRYVYVPTGGIVAAISWSVIMMLWMVQFVLACQQMVISGAVASYYFSRDKLALVHPIYNSFYNLVRYHLGTVAFGSFSITVVTFLNFMIRSLASQNGAWRLLYLCFRPVENLVKYLTSMGYIETAIHGQPLCRSAIRAINLIVSNLLSAIAINSLGNFVFFMAKFAITALTVGVGVLLQYDIVTVVFGGLVALLCVHCFFVVFEIAVDTIFICYCEDQCMNDGNTNPYYATLELHNQIKRAQVITLALEQAKLRKKSKK